MDTPERETYIRIAIAASTLLDRLDSMPVGARQEREALRLALRGLNPPVRQRQPTKAFYVVYGGWYGHLEDWDGEECQWKPGEWTYGTWTACGNSQLYAREKLDEAQQRNYDFCGICIEYES